MRAASQTRCSPERNLYAHKFGGGGPRPGGDRGGGQGGHRGPPQGPQRGPSDGEPKGGPRDKSPSSSAENTHCNPALTQASLGRRPQPVAGPGEREAGERGTPLAGVTGQFPANWRSTSLSSPARSGSRILHRRGTACSTHAPAAELPAWGGSTNRAGRQHSARIKDRPSGRQSATDKYTEGERSSASPPTGALASCRLPATTVRQTRKPGGAGEPLRVFPMGQGNPWERGGAQARPRDRGYPTLHGGSGRSPMDGMCPGLANIAPDQALLIQGSTGVTRGGG